MRSHDWILEPRIILPYYDDYVTCSHIQIEVYYTFTLKNKKIVWQCLLSKCVQPAPHLFRLINNRSKCDTKSRTAWHTIRYFLIRRPLAYSKQQKVVLINQQAGSLLHCYRCLWSTRHMHIDECLDDSFLFHAATGPNHDKGLKSVSC